MTKAFFSELFSRTKHTFLWIDYLQYIIRQTSRLKVPKLFIDPNQIMLQASYHLSKAIQENGDIDKCELEKTKRVLQIMIRRRDVEGGEESLAWCKEKIRTLGSVYFHKVIQGKNEP